MTAKLDTDLSDIKILEKYSSAFTLSDMEIFIFPDLFYPLVLANIMSPVIWKWRDDPWFADIEKKSFVVKANRIKQYIIQNYVFNLDLSTWGLTTKSTEIDRFNRFFDINTLKQSNALFGYEGDKYYFDIDIRKHFGLDKYNSDVIPYWKTETVEAMTAFRYKENFTTGAGECVSLSSLYAAAMFIIGRIPLEKIYLMATPLHSQNFILEKEGLITNNRRIVTKNMWYNGTSLSEKARRAMENEKVTIVSHITGYIHTLYNEATIDKKSYKAFSDKLKEFLVTEFTNHIFINFLRFKSKYKTLFQYRCECAGKKNYITLEKMFEYEHNSKFNVSAESRPSLMKEIEGDEFHLSPIQGKIMLNDIENLINEEKGMPLEVVENKFINMINFIPEDIIHQMFIELRSFIAIEPRLPDVNKNFIDGDVLKIDVNSSRDQIVNQILQLSDRYEIAQLTLYAYRQMDRINWIPFIKASIERNPVALTELKEKATDDIYKIIDSFTNESIYDDKRMALPDEVWNFRRGDGIEKAILFADYLIDKDKSSTVTIKSDNKDVQLTWNGNKFNFISKKNFRKTISIEWKKYQVE